mmetsp:Transcript_8775/g.25129  ORF Transcript_8775/g.25129 Transcript_8775/m.25129 type:complete len:237 (+) Transcript_8775:274-984(+)
MPKERWRKVRGAGREPGAMSSLGASLWKLCEWASPRSVSVSPVPLRRSSRCNCCCCLARAKGPQLVDDFLLLFELGGWGIVEPPCCVTESPASAFSSSVFWPRGVSMPYMLVSWLAHGETKGNMPPRQAPLLATLTRATLASGRASSSADSSDSEGRPASSASVSVGGRSAPSNRHRAERASVADGRFGGFFSSSRAMKSLHLALTCLNLSSNGSKLSLHLTVRISVDCVVLPQKG